MELKSGQSNVIKEAARGWQGLMPSAIDRVEKGQFNPRDLDPFEPGDYVEFIRDSIPSKIDLLRGKTYVDIGAGLGSNLHDAVSSLGAEVVNVDISHHAVAYSKKKQEEEGITGSAFMLPFADASIEGVLSSNLINDTGSMGDNMEAYQIHVNKFMEEIFRILKSGGLFIQANYGGNYTMRVIGERALRLSGFRGIIERSYSSLLAQNQERFKKIINKNASARNRDPLIFIARKP